MPPFQQTEDKTCQGCGEYMHGVNTYVLRKLCEACGGNPTPHNADNPKRNEVKPC